MTPEQAQIGVSVVYRAHPDARPEDGFIMSTRSLDRDIVHVLYVGDVTPKATRLADLEVVNDTVTLSGHQHETWQIQPDAHGGHYCAACGARIGPTP